MKTFQEQYEEGCEKKNRVLFHYFKDRLSAFDPAKLEVWGNSTALIYSWPGKWDLYKRKNGAYGPYNYASIAYNAICEAFEIPEEEKPVFLSSLLEVGLGKGKEMANLSLVNLFSSSLACLLFFYRISKEHPFVYEGIEYVTARFEFENPATDPKHPSCLDVVLFDRSRHNALCIECKFSEYLDLAWKKELDPTSVPDSIPFDSTYAAWFFNLGIKDERLSKDIFLGDGTINCYGTRYLYGAKQLFTHVYGMCNMKNPYLEEPHPEDAADFETIKYREVVFDFGDFDSDNSFDDFADLYHHAARQIVQSNSNVRLGGGPNTVDVGQEIVSYQLFFQGQEDILLPKVREFYGL